MDRLLTFFGVERERDELPQDVYPNGLAPMLRLRPDSAGGGAVRSVVDAVFRFVPEQISALEWARKTYNARSETVATKPTFRQAWAAGQRCIIPAEVVFEPRYFGSLDAPGRSERWAIRQPGDVPMGIAGVYTTYTHPQTGEVLFAMAMLTVNADGHPVMDRFFKPGEEKRMVTILDPADYDRWLTCSVEEARGFFKTWPGPLDIEHAPREPRKAVRPSKPAPDPGPTTGDLF